MLQEIYDLVCEDQEPYILSTEQKLRIEKARKEIQEGQIISEEEANRKTELSVWDARQNPEKLLQRLE